MKILRYKTVSYEDAIDAVICAQNGLTLKNNMTVNFCNGKDGPVAIVEPLDLDVSNILGEENENYIVTQER